MLLYQEWMANHDLPLQSPTLFEGNCGKATFNSENMVVPHDIILVATKQKAENACNFVSTRSRVIFTKIVIVCYLSHFCW